MPKASNVRTKLLDTLLSYAAPTASARGAVLRRYLAETVPEMEDGERLIFDKGMLTVVLEALPKSPIDPTGPTAQRAPAP